MTLTGVESIKRSADGWIYAVSDARKGGISAGYQSDQELVTNLQCMVVLCESDFDINKDPLSALSELVFPHTCYL